MATSKCIIRVKFATGERHMSVNMSDANLDSRTYDYFWMGEAAAGQFAVVEACGVLKVVKIAEVLRRSTKATKHAVAVFGLEDHKAAMKVEVRKAELFEAIEERVKKTSWLKRMEEIANSTGDGELKAMVNEIKLLED